MTIENDGELVQIDVDDQWIAKERKRIEDTCTYLVPNFGRAIFHKDREKFDEEVERVTELQQGYQRAAKDQIETAREAFIAGIAAEFAPRWRTSRLVSGSGRLSSTTIGSSRSSSGSRRRSSTTRYSPSSSRSA